VKEEKMGRRRSRRQRLSKSEQGGSVIEAVIGIPILLGIAFNIINFGYMWFLVLAISAAPRMGAQYATQGGGAGSSSPSATSISDLVYENVTHAIRGATTSNVAVQVCTAALGVSGSGIAQCQQYGSTFTFPGPVADPEAPVFVLDRVDVEYTVKPIIPGTAFNVVLPGNLNFHRQVSMRSLY
jgi:Flp pilus assembly protein TadG